MKVRVRNFQSLEDVSLTIKGLTVVTGPNNSGKTALMRAIRGVFENSPSGPLVRYGEEKLTVDIEFDDGKSVTWEKGSKDNSYVINGYKLETVGRGAPTELAELGVKPIQVGNTTLFPQIARQFKDTLFLVDSSGAVLAEALSDVEKVGRLNNGMRFAEKDKRSASGELKVRHKDLKKQEEIVDTFNGFDQVDTLMENLETLKAKIGKLGDSIEKIKSLRDTYNHCKDQVAHYAQLSLVEIPSAGKTQRLCSAKDRVSAFKAQHSKAQDTLQFYNGTDTITIPNIDTDRLEKQIHVVRGMQSRLFVSKALVARFNDFEIPSLPSVGKLPLIQSKVVGIKELQKSLVLKKDQLSSHGHTISETEKQYISVCDFIDKALGDLGVCPTCKRVHND